MKKKMGIFLTSALLFYNSISLAASNSINDYTIITEDYPPFNYSDKDVRKGLSTEIFELILKNLNSTKTVKDIKALPWSTGYNLALSKENTALFSMARISEREELFKWVGPITSVKVSIIAPKSKGIKLSKIEDLVKYKIGLVKDDAAKHLLLLSYNVPKDNLKEFIKLSDSISQLDAGSIDLAASGEIAFKSEIKQKGKKNNDYETVFLLKESELFYAFNKNTPDSLIKQVQEAFDKVKNSPE